MYRYLVIENLKYIRLSDVQVQTSGIYLVQLHIWHWVTDSRISGLVWLGLVLGLEIRLSDV